MEARLSGYVPPPAHSLFLDIHTLAAIKAAA